MPSDEQWNAGVPEGLKEALVAQLVQVRRDRGLSMRALAELTGVSSSIFSRLETRAGRVEMATVIKYAWALDKELVLVDRVPDA